MQRIAWIGAVLVGLAGLALVCMVVLIRTGLQRYSDEAAARFPGERMAALIQVVGCERCPLEDRDHAVWVLGQMAEVRAESALRKHYDGQACDHKTRLCQSELKKAIRMIETRGERTGFVARIVEGWHRPLALIRARATGRCGPRARVRGGRDLRQRGIRR